MKKKSMLFWLAILIFSCSSINVQALKMGNAGPSILKSSILPNAENVPVNTSIIVTFSKSVKSNKNISDIKLKTDDGITLGTKILVSNKTMTIKPIKPLKYNTIYTLNIPLNAVKDYSGMFLQKAYPIKFKTEINKFVNSQGYQADFGKALHGFYAGSTKYDEVVQRYLKDLTSVSFAWLSLDQAKDKKIFINDKNRGRDFYKPKDYDKPLAYCKENNISAQIALFSNRDFAVSVISNDDLRKNLIQDIIENLEMKLPDGSIFDFNGVVIDFENFKLTDKAYFNTFLKELKQALSPLDKKLYVAVGVGSSNRGYDYKEILKNTDQLILMAHDYEPKKTLNKTEMMRYIKYNKHNPILTSAPITSVKIALEDVISQINKLDDMKKIYLQLSFAVIQWQFKIGENEEWSTIKSDSVAQRYTPAYKTLLDSVVNNKKDLEEIHYGYIKELESPYLTFSKQNSKTFNFLIYEDSRSVNVKIELAKKLGIGGISLWRLGNIPDDFNQGGTEDYFNLWSTIIENTR